LTGGTWQAVNKGILRLIGANLTTDAANILIDGATSQVFNDTGSTSALTNLATIGAAGNFTIQNGFNFTTAGSLNDAGRVDVGPSSTLNQTGNLLLENGGTLGTNAGGTFNLTGNMSVSQSGGGTLTNAGTLEKTAGTGTSTISSSFVNSGAITVQGGTLVLASAGGTSTGGTFNVSKGATLDLTGGATVAYGGS
jgi:hypothetical protein